MPTDPQHIEIGDVGRRRAQDAADIRRRIDTLERTPSVQAAAGPPINECRDGTLHVDSFNLRLYVRAGGAWHYVALS